MAATVGEPRQHKQPSRKGKRAWRKNVDITSVQDGLESLRDEIRQGGPIAEKHSDDLFVVDTVASEDIKKKHKISKPLKVDQILAERSAVPAVDGRKRAHSKIGDGILEPDSKRQRKDWVSKKEVHRLRRDVNKRSHLETDEKAEATGADFDLWGQEPAATTAVTRQEEYIPKQKPKVAPKSITRAPTAITASGKAVKAVPNPDAGTSYNPSFESWDELLTREGAREVEAETPRHQKAAEQADREARIAAIAAADEREGQSDYESAWESFDTDNEAEMLKKKRPERKTPAQRNKIKRRVKEEQLKRHEMAMGRKQQQNDQSMLALSKRDDAQDLATLDRPVQDEAPEDGTNLRRRKLGKTTIPDKPLELVLPEELQESLRRLKPEGNLLGDRFRNLLVNGKIESRKPVLQVRKKRVKMTEKWSYKDFGVKPEVY